MNWKRFFALLLVLALLPALFGNAFAAGPKARTLTDADYAPIDALWAELDAVEQDAQTQSAQDGSGPDARGGAGRGGGSDGLRPLCGRHAAVARRAVQL